MRGKESNIKEPLNNKPCILVKHAIQAFFSEYRAYLYS